MMATKNTPLAERVRPQTLDEFVGQEHLMGQNGPLKKLILQDNLVSMIFWGPPGSGKTTLARLIAKQTQAKFYHFSAVSTTLNDLRKAIKEASAKDKKGLSLFPGQEKTDRVIIFIDEIHRFNKAQQDSLLPYVEDGTIIFIGATTENPSFEIISPLLSRCRVFVLNQLNEVDMSNIITRGLKELNIKLAEEAKKFLVTMANGDSRSALNVLEVASRLSPKIKTISLRTIEEATQKKPLYYDYLGDEHFNTISAFIKSMRASNLDASLYYLARMVEAGEDPLFIARRMVIFASEDIGLAQPTALVVANEVFRACEIIGYPECQINLAHGTAYLAKAQKDRSAYDAYFLAKADVISFGNLPIPLELRNATTKLLKELKYGQGYTAYPGANVSLLPDKIKGKKYFLEKTKK